MVQPEAQLQAALVSQCPGATLRLVFAAGRAVVEPQQLILPVALLMVRDGFQQLWVELLVLTAAMMDILVKSLGGLAAGRAVARAMLALVVLAAMVPSVAAVAAAVLVLRAVLGATVATGL